jgi:hypothetical protein
VPIGRRPEIVGIFGALRMTGLYFPSGASILDLLATRDFGRPGDVAGAARCGARPGVEPAAAL